MKQKEIKKMVAPNRFVTGIVDALPPAFIQQTINDCQSVNVFVWDNNQFEIENPKISGIENISSRNESRRSRKQRKDYIHFERLSTGNFSNKYIAKHTITSLDKNEIDTKFTILK